jgi:hypothetical protein
MSSEEQMSGKPQFDERAVIAAAVEVFWLVVCGRVDQRFDGGDRLSRSSLTSVSATRTVSSRGSAAYLERVLRRMEAAQGETGRARSMRSYALPAVHPRSNDPMAVSSREAALNLRNCSETDSRDDAAAAREHEVPCGFARLAKGELAEDADVEAMSWHYFGVLQAVPFPQAGADLTRSGA